MNKNDLITDLSCPPLVPDCFWLRAPETDKESDSVMRLDSSVFTSLLRFTIAKFWSVLWIRKYFFGIWILP